MEERSRRQPAYMRVYMKIRREIVRGSYPYGSRLPSKRVLAADEGVSVITAEHAYSLLEDEGYIEARERSGFYVIFRTASGPFTDRQPVSGPDPSFRTEAEPFTIRQHAGGSDLSFPLHAAVRNADRPAEKSDLSFPRMAAVRNTDRPAEKSDLSFPRADAVRNADRPAEKSDLSFPRADAVRNADRPADHFPFSVLARTMRRVLTEEADRILVKPPAQGLLRLRGAIAAYLARSRGMHVSPAQIVIGAGSEYLYTLIAQILGTKEIMGLEDPSYIKIRQVYEANGIRCEGLPMGPDGIDSAALARSAARVLHVTPCNSYPSGVTATASKRQEYVRFIRERNGLLIEDDFDSEFSVLRKAEDTLFSLEPEEHVIYMNTFTRTVAPSMRLGYMVLPAARTETFLEKIRFYSCTVPVFEQYVLAELLNSGDFERHISRVRRRRRRESVRTASHL